MFELINKSETCDWVFSIKSHVSYIKDSLIVRRKNRNQKRLRLENNLKQILK